MGDAKGKMKHYTTTDVEGKREKNTKKERAEVARGPFIENIPQGKEKRIRK